MRRFEARYKHLGMKPPFDFLRVRAFKEQLNRFLEIGRRLLNRRSLAGHVQLGTERRVQVALFFYNCRIAGLRHGSVTSQFRACNPCRSIAKLL